MLHIKILGPGCAKCYAVERAAKAALEALKRENPELETTIRHIQDYSEIEKYPILFTPGLVVNERLVCAGRIPKKDEIIRWYEEALAHPDQQN